MCRTLRARFNCRPWVRHSPGGVAPRRRRNRIVMMRQCEFGAVAASDILSHSSKGVDMTAAKLERGRRSVVKDFSDVLAEAETLLKQAAAETGDRASDLRSQVEAKLLSAKLKLQDLQDDAVDRAKAAARVTDDYVRDNPWQAIGAAAAVGFLVGVLISRR